MASLAELLDDVRACGRCAATLPLGPRPVLQCHESARIVIAGQAPGKKVHESGVPFDDASGERLRGWLGISPEDFHNPRKVAIMPMSFCYPGTGEAGDLPPRGECAATWRARLLARLTRVELTIVLGRYAQAYHLGGAPASVTAIVKAWRGYWPEVVPLPHPSPRNNRWLARNPWFDAELLPAVKRRVAEVLGCASPRSRGREHTNGER